MPHGLRGRVALIGAGVVCCTGLAGCMGDSAGKAPPVSKAKAGQVTPPGARTTVPDIRPVGGSGLPSGGGFQPGTVPPGGFQPGAPTPNYTGGISSPVTPGNYGPGAPLPGAPPVVPQMTPTSYYQSPTTPAAPTTARAAAPNATPPLLSLAELPPQPPAPPGAHSPADTLPPPAPAHVPGPIAPTPPFPPVR
ncbi:MAG TPA: hypothetical protein VD866_03710 [Urbifossiella sp.]|nr:hypothetical protein [Urbifossiella sp.]